MPIDLLNNQWEIGGVVFGVDSTIGHEANVSPPGRTWRTQDTPRPMSDATMMGRDYIEPDVWGFELFTDCEDEASAMARLELLGQIWYGDDVRNTPGRVMPLRYRMNDRTRVVFGRPRKFDYTLDNRMFDGYIPITCDFQLVSALFYDDDESQVPVGMNQPTSGGFSTPFRFPLRISRSSGLLPYTFSVGGIRPSHIAVDFRGPLNESGLLIDGEYVIQLAKPVPDGVTVTVDAQPWVTSVYRNDGAGVAGMLSPRSRMPGMTLKVGSHSATLLGTSPTGTGGAVIRWRTAYPTI